MAFDTVSISSDEDVPLKAIWHEPVTSTSLKRASLQNCDFCEEVFLNKYDALIHNAKHIIIPLIKQELHQCPLCLFYFTSRYKLKHHTRNKHKNDIKLNENVYVNNDVIILKENVNVKNDVSKLSRNVHVIGTMKVNNEKHVNIDNKHKHDEKSKVNENIVTKYESDDDDDVPLVNGNFKTIKETEEAKCETIVLREALLKDVKVVIEKIEFTPKNFEPLSVKPENAEAKETQKIAPKIAKLPDQNEKAKTIDTSPLKAEIPDNVSKSTVTPKVKISSRLRFEDDIDFDDAVMKDLTTDCIVNMNLFDKPWLDELTKDITNDNVGTDVICIDDDDEEKEMDVYSPSTHHDELVKPGVYRCRKCQQMFPTRFNQIQHEMTHMHISKPRPVLCEHCDRFIANKKALKDHIASKHQLAYRPRTYRACTKCGLKYNNYEQHLENYHNVLRCHLCNKGFESDIDRLNHIRGHLVKIKCNLCGFVASELEIHEHRRRFHQPFVTLAEFNLCDVCCLFLKNKHNTHYIFGETVSKLGSRIDCEHCGNRFFHVTQVRRTVKGRPMDSKVFETVKERKKVLTNTDRLRNIQQRLKMINKLSRF